MKLGGAERKTDGTAAGLPPPAQERSQRDTCAQQSATANSRGIYLTARERLTAVISRKGKAVLPP